MKKNLSNQFILFFIVMSLISFINGCFKPSKNVSYQGSEENVKLSSNIRTYEFTNMPVVYNKSPKGDVLLGGFSGLSFNESDSTNDNLSFTTVTDKLPFGFLQNKTSDSPAFIPLIVNFSLNMNNNTISIINTRQIKPSSSINLNSYTNYDYEGITNASNLDYWLVEESIPALVHINHNGEIIQRFVPINTPINKLSIDVEALPEKYNHLKKNGFEGIAYNNETKKLYLFLQNELKTKFIDFNKKAKHTTWIVEFDIAKKEVTAEYLYPSLNKIKISGATHYKDNEFLVLERTKDKTTDLTTFNINRISIDKATNVLDYFTLDKPDNYLKLKNYQLIKSIEPVKISNYINLSELGFNKDSKFEGMTYLGYDRVSIINDNDFGIDTSTGCNLVIIELK